MPALLSRAIALLYYGSLCIVSQSLTVNPSGSRAAAAPHGNAAVIDDDDAEFLPHGMPDLGYLRMRRVIKW